MIQICKNQLSLIRYLQSKDVALNIWIVRSKVNEVGLKDTAGEYLGPVQLCRIASYLGAILINRLNSAIVMDINENTWWYM